MKLITTTDDLAAFCKPLAATEFIAVDTEFMRERTYWPKLCLAQVAGPDDAAAIDALAEGIDLAPLDELMANAKVLKVFHAARQDLEIFYLRMNQVPQPLFDTQIAAMVCGHGEAASYESLATKLAKAKIDKSSRFTDWSRRPLSERQISYALSDVTHLRVVYEKLRRQLEKSGRLSWITEEVAVLNDPATYRADPEQAWRRLKPRGASPRLLGTLKEVAAWRERTAQRIDIPRQRLLRDEQLLEIASHAPKTTEDLAMTRGLGRGFAEGWQGRELMEAIERARNVPEAELPTRDKAPEQLRAPSAVVDLLRTLLRLKAEQAGVAGRLVASADELDRLAAGRRDIAAL
ncbi:MAG TPA: ribonuclease D, partial [Reyranella sp.]|nr:ribonuclease D [Reyranella sp.]